MQVFVSFSVNICFHNHTPPYPICELTFSNQSVNGYYEQSATVCSWPVIYQLFPYILDLKALQLFVCKSAFMQTAFIKSAFIFI